MDLTNELRSSAHRRAPQGSQSPPSASNCSSVGVNSSRWEQEVENARKRVEEAQKKVVTLQEQLLQAQRAQHDAEEAFGRLLESNRSATERGNVTEPNRAGSREAQPQNQLVASATNDEDFARQLQQTEWAEQRELPQQRQQQQRQHPEQRRQRLLRAFSDDAFMFGGGDDPLERFVSGVMRGGSGVGSFASASGLDNLASSSFSFGMGGPLFRFGSLPGGVFGGPNLENMSYEELSQRFPGNQPQGAQQSDIERLPTREYGATQPMEVDGEEQKQEKEAKKCSICLEEFASGDQVRVLPCFHEFHTEEIDHWLKQNKNCPVCRVPIDSQNPPE